MPRNAFENNDEPLPLDIELPEAEEKSETELFLEELKKKQKRDFSYTRRDIIEKLEKIVSEGG